MYFALSREMNDPDQICLEEFLPNTLIQKPTVKVLTILQCQLLFLVVGIKTDKLWSKLKEQDHETGL